MVTDGIKYPKSELDIDILRAYGDGMVFRLATGLAGMAKDHKVDVIQGDDQFLDPHHLEVSLITDDVHEQTTPVDEKEIVAFKNCVIAVGSRVTKLPFIPEDPHIIDSSSALTLKEVPGRLLIVGGGIIGLEMDTVYSTLDSRLDTIGMVDGLMQSIDRDLTKIWQKQNEYCSDSIMINTKTVAVESRENGVCVIFEGANAPKEPQRYDAILMAAGRASNGRLINAEKTGIAVTDHGFIEVDRQMHINVLHICTISDIVGQLMLAHKAIHEGHVTAESRAGHRAYLNTRVIPGVAYTSPKVAWVGETGLSAKASGRKITKANFSWAASDRTIANGCDNGFTKLIFDAGTSRIIDDDIIGPNGGDMIGGVCLAIEVGYDATNIGKTVRPHPTLGESIGMTVEVALGICTNLPAQKKK